MIIFISGGAKNGKSSLAQELAVKLARGGKRYYVATMIPHDREDHARIARHLREREGWGFTTLECGKDITNCIIDKNINGSFLFDSVTALLANEMFPGPEPDLAAPARVERMQKRPGNLGNLLFFIFFFILLSASCTYDKCTHF